MGLFIILTFITIIFLYSHITELSVQYNAELQVYNGTDLHFDSHLYLLGTLISPT